MTFLKKDPGKNTDGRKLFRPSDMIPVIILLAVPVIYFLAGAVSENDGAYAEISRDGEVVAAVPLGMDGVYSYPLTGDMEFTVSDGGIRVSRSNCPDKTCMETGRLCHTGDIAVCVPNRVTVTVCGEKDGDVDGVLR